MKPPFRSANLFTGALLAGLLLAACGPTAAPTWTFAPLGPTPAPAETPDGESPAPGETPDGESPAPGETPNGESPPPGEAVTLNVTTTQEAPLEFEPNQLDAPPSTEVTVVYLNDSNIIHNIHFFAGGDPGAETLGATELATGPGAEEQVTFTTPAEAGDYFFHCDVHPTMTGTLTVGE